MPDDLGHGPVEQEPPETHVPPTLAEVSVAGSLVRLTRRATNMSKTIYMTVNKDTVVIVDGKPV